MPNIGENLVKISPVLKEFVSKIIKMIDERCTPTTLVNSAVTGMKFTKYFHTT